MIGWIAEHQSLLIGLVMMAVIGPAVGNYVCSVVYRLPRGQTPFERHPYCGHCGADLQPRDLFPILSWLSTRGRCRYCRGRIPGIYTLIEIACGVVFIAYYHFYYVTEYFLMAACYAVFVITLAGIQWREGWISATIYSYAMLATGMFVISAYGTIFDWLTPAFVMLVVCLLLQRMHAGITGSDARPFHSPWIWWMVLMAAWVPIHQWSLLAIPVALLLIFRFACRQAGSWVLFPIAAFALCLPPLMF